MFVHLNNYTIIVPSASNFILDQLNIFPECVLNYEIKLLLVPEIMRLISLTK